MEGETSEEASLPRRGLIESVPRLLAAISILWVKSSILQLDRSEKRKCEPQEETTRSFPDHRLQRRPWEAAARRRSTLMRPRPLHARHCHSRQKSAAEEL